MANNSAGTKLGAASPPQIISLEVALFKGGRSISSLTTRSWATLHAELIADSSGSWKLIGKKTGNGVWVTATTTPLASCCFFQCGEQRFKFVIP